MKLFLATFCEYVLLKLCEQQFVKGYVYNKDSLSAVKKESNDNCKCQQNSCSEKIQKQFFGDVLN